VELELISNRFNSANNSFNIKLHSGHTLAFKVITRSDDKFVMIAWWKVKTVMQTQQSVWNVSDI
jgi:hypothetical protein